MFKIFVFIYFNIYLFLTAEHSHLREKLHCGNHDSEEDASSGSLVGAGVLESGGGKDIEADINLIR